MRLTQRIAVSLFAITATGSLPEGALAQTYPYKPIRWLVPFGPGGAADIVSRLVAPKLAEGLGGQLVVDNRPGGGTIIATELLANASPDGYTLMLANISFGANPGLHSKLPYDTLRSFVPVVLVDVMPNVLLVHPTVPVKSVGDLVALAKSKPGQLNYGSAGMGSANHLNTELFKSNTGIDMVHIPYQSGGQLVAAILGTQVHLAFITLPPALPHVKAGRLRVLAVTGSNRMAALPDVPTIGETVLPEFVFHEWHGVLAPRGTPKEIVNRLNAEINRLIAASDFKERIASLGAEVKGSTPEQFANHLRIEVAKWTKVLKPIN